MKMGRYLRRKPIVILIWLIVFLAPLPLALHSAGSKIPSKKLPRGVGWLRLNNLDSRVEKYLRSSPPQTVILGPSYARQLGEFGEIHNLGFDMARPSEIVALARKYCRKDDHFFFFLSLRDIYYLSEKPRIEVTNVSFRNIIISKLFLQSRLDIFPDSIKKRPVSAEDRLIFSLSLAPEEFESDPKVNVDVATRTSISAIYNLATVEEINLTLFVEFANEFPNTIIEAFQY